MSLLRAIILGSLPLILASTAQATELPTRKAGLWEMQFVATGRRGGRTTTIQHCTDETTDKKMISSTAPWIEETCSKKEIQKTATGYVTDSVCNLGGTSLTSYSVVTGDFNSAYTMHLATHDNDAPPGQPADSSNIIEAKWLGPCAADQKPGDIIVRGLSININDIERLRALRRK